MRYLLGFVIFLVFSSCHQTGDTRIVTKDTNADEIIEIADRLSIKKQGIITIVKIKDPWQGSKSLELEYLLVERDKDLPPDTDMSKVIYVPLESIVCMSASHVAMVAALGQENKISGVSGSSYIYNERVTGLVKNGSVEDVGYDAGLNNELIMKIRPDLVMAYGIGAESAGYVAKLEEAGIKIIFNADYLEEDPLGKAEWIKLFGALFCRGKIADSIFRSEVEAYDKIKNQIAINADKRPNVLLGLPYKDTWYISPGNSYISMLIYDAGGRYLWEDVKSDKSMPMGIENIFMHAMKAEYWFNAGTALSVNDIKAVDTRLASLPCFKNVYNNNLKINPYGGNDYWEEGTVHPHLILKDMAAILHPEFFVNHKLILYRKIN